MPDRSNTGPRVKVFRSKRIEHVQNCVKTGMIHGEKTGQSECLMEDLTEKRKTTTVLSSQRLKKKKQTQFAAFDQDMLHTFQNETQTYKTSTPKKKLAESVKNVKIVYGRFPCHLLVFCPNAPCKQSEDPFQRQNATQGTVASRLFL